MTAWADRWFASRVDLKPKTRSSYASLLRSRILPILGQRPIAGLSPLEVQEWVAQLQNAGLSASRVRQAAHLVGALMQDAVAEGLIWTNPCAGLRLPRITDSEIEFLTAVEVERLAAAIAPPYGVLVHVLAYSGLRIGEALALRRRRIDIDRRRLLVSESLADVSSQLSFGQTKTHQTRSIVLANFLATLLEGHLDQEVGQHPDALVFTSERGQPVRYGNFASASGCRR